ncbi:hybrid sensor histidine kinase/response regulator [Alcanivorax sp. S71-1-4]|uniref:hybrid sensor histidine kinase/response regulator n=1 Tax=Alcanivorax sp. S71-1-4 TaxID=1177159 RepID=UPI00135B25B8|nr:hybrid sensor histidine kinase/response regulator [Alcanivorax sp. S71-1-4]
MARPHHLPHWTLCWLVWGISLWWPVAVQGMEAGRPGGWQQAFESYLDASGTLPPDQVMQQSFILRERIMARHGDGVWWLRLSLHNSLPQPVTRWVQIEPARLADVQLYAPDGARLAHTGASVPLARRPLDNRAALLPVSLPAAGERTVYVRIEHNSATAVQARAWIPDVFLRHERRLDFFNALQFGAMLWFAVYGVLAFFSSRQTAFLYFSLLVASCALVDISFLQYGLQYFWPDAVAWNLRASLVFSGLLLPAAGLLVTRLLNMRRRYPLGYMLINGLSWIVLAEAVARLFGMPRLPGLLPMLLPLTLLLSLAGWSLRAAWQGVPGARLLLLAFALTWCVTLYGIGKILGWWLLPSLNGLSMNWAMLLSSVMMVRVLGDTVRQFRLEREQARADAAEARLALNAQALRARALTLEKEAAEAASEAKSTFLAHLSHELRTPLHSILGYSALILQDIPATGHSMLTRRASAIQRSGRHLLALIDELLDYARGEAGRLVLAPQPLDIDALLNSVLDEMRQLAHSQNVTLALHPDNPPGCQVMADGLRLRQILLNLVSNACRHSGGDRVLLQCCVAPQREPPGTLRLSFAVSDNGKGIPDADRARLFRPFEQGDSGYQQGVGLGLPIARQWVNLMGGELDCENLPGNGCRFYFSVAVPGLAGPLNETITAHEVRGYQGPVQHLLVVDDTPENLALLCDGLTAAGFRVSQADNGAAALQCLAADPVDAVITDQRMPGLSGRALLRAARREGYSMPWLLLSATVQGMSPVPEDDADFAAVLLKPVSISALVRELCRVLVLEPSQAESPPPVTPDATTKPDAAAMARLRLAVQVGALSDIEDWSDNICRTQPAASGFARRVLGAARALDMPALEQLLGPAEGPL